LNHPYIVKCYGIFEDGRNSYLATEYISRGTLKDYLAHNGTSVDNKGKTKDKSAVAIFKKLLEALSYLSSKGFVHRDLKPANIMVKEFFCNKTNEKLIHPVIIDFGFS
jgi:serine/threonine protein kinase